MQLIPPALVPAVQAYLATQGQNPNLINPDGSTNDAGLFGLLFNQVEIRTSVTPSLIFPISADGQPGSPAMQQLITSLQPTVIFTGPAGRVEVAPYGATQGATSWLPVVAVGGLLVIGIGWLVFGR